MRPGSNPATAVSAMDEDSMMGVRPSRGRGGVPPGAAAILTCVRRQGSAGVLLVTGGAGTARSSVVSSIVADGAGVVRVGRAKVHEADRPVAGDAVLNALGSGRDPLLSADRLDDLIELTDRPRHLLERTSALLRTVAERQPVMLVVDDVQWADQVSRFLLQALPARLADLPLRWILSSADPDVDVFRRLRDRTRDAVPVRLVELGPTSSGVGANSAADPAITGRP
jgi:hypothetical protein